MVLRTFSFYANSSSFIFEVLFCINTIDMLGKLQGWNDTIVALATPQGIGAIGVIRVSGVEAINIVDKLFPSKDLNAQATHTIHVGYLKENNTIIDEVVISLFKAPKSYTGENVVEISCHGSWYIQQQILDLLVKYGARFAKPGEFTQRAFLSGKFDLTQAEAVADLIASNTEASRKNALKNMRGGFSSILKVLRDQLIQFSALIELELDFSQEDVEFVDRTRLFELLKEIQKQVTSLLQSFKLGNVIKNGVQVAIIGKPNAGKSTLLNTLLNEQRAIVSDIAGTTRDTIEETLNINGILFRLIDTAGIREHTTDIIESIGVEKSLEKMRAADVVIYLFDVNEESAEEINIIEQSLLEQHIKYLLIGNKADINRNVDEQNKFLATTPIIYISAKHDENIEQLKQRLFELAVNEKSLLSDTLITNARHVGALEKVQQSLSDIIEGMSNGLPGDLIALDIRRCLHFLGEITGEITNEDQLDYIFSKFCIGK